MDRVERARELFDAWRERFRDCPKSTIVGFGFVTAEQAEAPGAPYLVLDEEEVISWVRETMPSAPLYGCLITPSDTRTVCVVLALT